ncbi:MAG: flagellar hook-length control protein FliK [Planctomycetaceae bacterium]|jgi:hypothetical protein|nr:flagellar hook-length control protein FliK [Planctomycetaceae bacterium]
MSVDNTTTYSVSPATISPTVVRSQDLNTLNTAFAAAFQASVIGKKINNANIQNNSAGTIGTNMAVETLLHETEITGQSENIAEKNIHNKRNNNKKTETTQHGNKQLDKISLNQNELRNSEIKTDYINQLDRREQIRNEYINRLNKREEQNKTGIIHEQSKELPQVKEPPRQLTTNANFNPTQTITTIAKNSNTANNNDHIRFLNVSNHRAVVREVLGQHIAETDIAQPEISATIMVSIAIAQKESTRAVANGQQTTFTIFTPTGRIEQVEYDRNQNNNRQQNDKNNEDKKEKNKNKKNIEQLQSDKLPADNFLASNINSDILNDSRRQKNSITEKTELLSFNNKIDVGENDTIDRQTDNKEVFDISQLPEFIVTILSNPVKYTEQIDLNNNTPETENDLTNKNANDNEEEYVDDYDWTDISRRHRLLLRVAAACRSMANRNNTFRIKLNLENSGELFIRITKNKGNYSVYFNATNTDVAEKLNNGLVALKQSLEEDNVKLDNVTIDIGQI